MKLATPLRTSRLVLRTLTVADATERYLGWMRDPETTRFLESRLVDHDLASLSDYIASCNDSPGSMLLGICLADGTHVGNIKLGPIDPYHQHAAIGLLIGERDRWGKGYATEAIAALTAHAFGQLGLQKLYAGCYASNVGSARAFLKAGWIEEGRNRGHWRSDGGREDNVQFGITRADWSASQS
jgi:RimJ/RimL family protein N-acetyltransferase